MSINERSMSGFVAPPNTPNICASTEPSEAPEVHLASMRLAETDDQQTLQKHKNEHPSDLQKTTKKNKPEILHYLMYIICYLQRVIY